MAAYTGRPGVDWGAVAQAVGVEGHLQAQEEARRTEAIRWQGQQDYRTLVDSGVDPAEALRRSSAKLFFNDPRGQAAVMGATRPARQEQPWVPTRGRTPEGDEYFMASPRSAIRIPPEAAAPTQKPLSPTASIALERAIADWSGRAALTAPGSPNPNPALYQTSTNNLAQLSALKNQFNLTSPTVGSAPIPSPVAPVPTNAAPVRVTTKAERDALPSGATYIGADGRTYRKK